MEAILLAAGIPSAIFGLLIWWLKRTIEERDRKRDAEREEHDRNLQEFMMMTMQMGRANNVLAVATAKAVQRIPDAKCNGDMTSALDEAAKIQKAEKDFLMRQGVKRVFAD